MPCQRLPVPSTRIFPPVARHHRFPRRPTREAWFLPQNAPQYHAMLNERTDVNRLLTSTQLVVPFISPYTVAFTLMAIETSLVFTIACEMIGMVLVVKMHCDPIVGTFTSVFWIMDVMNVVPLPVYLSTCVNIKVMYTF